MKCEISTTETDCFPLRGIDTNDEGVFCNRNGEMTIVWWFAGVRRRIVVFGDGDINVQSGDSARWINPEGEWRRLPGSNVTLTLNLKETT